ncbi:MAG: sugar ABC transporter permease [Spirochaetales bacterium]|nr:sugar ABC transporter permease [Spirochaetales bacterium]
MKKKQTIRVPRLLARLSLNQQHLAPYLFLSPFVLLYLIFGFFPNIFAFFLSLQKWSGMGPMEFVGLRNFGQLLFEDKFFWQSLYNTGWLLLFGSFTQHIIAIPLAIILNNKTLKGRDFFKTAYFLPFITSAVSVAIIFNYVFGNNFGLLNYVFEAIGLPRIDWLGNKEYIKPSIAIMVNWRYIGWNTVIYLAGLQAIPEELYESVEIDGANTLQKHIYITLPLLIPIIFFAVTLSIIGGMQLFDDPYMLTGGYLNMGGTGSAGLTSAFYIMWLLQRAQRYGKGSAITLLVFLIIIAMTVVNRLVTGRLQEDETVKNIK